MHGLPIGRGSHFCAVSFGRDSSLPCLSTSPATPCRLVAARAATFNVTAETGVGLHGRVDRSSVRPRRFPALKAAHSTAIKLNCLERLGTGSQAAILR